MIAALIAQLKIPGASSVDAPSGINPKLNTGLETAGKDFIQLIYSWVFLLGIILVLIFMIIAGIQWITSGGDSIKLAAAKKRMLYAVIGFLLITGAYFIVRMIIFVITGQTSSEELFFNFF